MTHGAFFFDFQVFMRDWGLLKIFGNYLRIGPEGAPDAASRFLTFL
jgi:hypothetical protein